MTLHGRFSQEAGSSVGCFTVETPTGDERVTVIQDNYGPKAGTVFMHNGAELRIHPPLSPLDPVAATLAELLVRRIVEVQE